MSFEFVQLCNGPLLNQIAQRLGPGLYFLVCIGHLNYFYSEDPVVVQLLKGLLATEHIVIHTIPHQDMIDVLTVNGTKEFQIFHGDSDLFEMVIKNVII